jgi:hypothetical protein
MTKPLFYLFISIIVFNIGCSSLKKEGTKSSENRAFRYDDTTLFAEKSPFLMPYNRIIDGAGKSVSYGNPEYENHSLDLVMIPNT